MKRIECIKRQIKRLREIRTTAWDTDTDASSTSTRSKTASKSKTKSKSVSAAAGSAAGGGGGNDDDGMDDEEIPYDAKTRFYASLIEYNDKATTRIKHACISNQHERQRFLKQLDSLKPMGNTDFLPAIEELEKLLCRSGLFRPKDKVEQYDAWMKGKEPPQRVITNIFFFSDGEPTDMRGQVDRFKSSRRTKHIKKQQDIPVLFDKVRGALERHIERLTHRPGKGVSADLEKPGQPSQELQAFKEAYEIALLATPANGLSHTDLDVDIEDKVLNRALEARMEEMFLKIWEVARRDQGRIAKGMFNIQFHGIGNLDGDCSDAEIESNSNFFEAMKLGLPSGCASFKVGVPFSYWAALS